MDTTNKKDAAEGIRIIYKVLFTVQGSLFLAIAVYSLTQTCSGTKNDKGSEVDKETMCNIAIVTTLLAGIQLGIVALVLMCYKTYLDDTFKAVACYVIYPIMPIYGISCLVVDVYKDAEMYAILTLFGFTLIIVLVQLILIVISKWHTNKDQEKRTQ